MNHKEKLALIAAVVMAQHNAKIPAKDAVQIADYLLQETEAAAEAHMPN